MQLMVWMQQLWSLIFFVHRMLTENSPLSDSIANVRTNERNNLQYRRQLFIRHKLVTKVYTKIYIKNIRRILHEYVFWKSRKEGGGGEEFKASYVVVRFSSKPSNVYISHRPVTSQLLQPLDIALLLQDVELRP